MGTHRVAGVRFFARPNDHLPRHVHAFVGDGEVIIDLLSGGDVRLSQRKAATHNVTESEVRKALKVAEKEHAALVEFWKKAHQ